FPQLHLHLHTTISFPCSFLTVLSSRTNNLLNIFPTIELFIFTFCGLSKLYLLSHSPQLTIFPVVNRVPLTQIVFPQSHLQSHKAFLNLSVPLYSIAVNFPNFIPIRFLLIF